MHPEPTEDFQKASIIENTSEPLFNQQHGHPDYDQHLPYSLAPGESGDGIHSKRSLDGFDASRRSGQSSPNARVSRLSNEHESFDEHLNLEPAITAKNHEIEVESIGDQDPTDLSSTSQILSQAPIDSLPNGTIDELPY